VPNTCKSRGLRVTGARV